MRRPKGLRTAATALLGALSWGTGAFGQAVNETPPELVGVDLVDRAGTTLPADLAFTASTGERVTLGGLLGSGRPVVLQLVYYNCPMLCSLVLNGYVEAAKELDWAPGRDYDVITVSFDPRDTPEIAAAKKKNYVEAFGKPEAAEGWSFLVGDSATVRTLADSVGFTYRWMEDRKEFAHAAGMFVLTPQGRVSRTLYGTSPEAKELRYSLVEASEGRLGSPLDKLLLYCFRYDAKTHKYAMVARNVMKVSGGVMAALVGGLLAVMWSRERRRARWAAHG